jgi:hypothetical protein
MDPKEQACSLEIAAIRRKPDSRPALNAATGFGSLGAIASFVPRVPPVLRQLHWIH